MAPRSARHEPDQATGYNVHSARPEGTETSVLILSAFFRLQQEPVQATGRASLSATSSASVWLSSSWWCLASNTAYIGSVVTPQAWLWRAMWM